MTLDLRPLFKNEKNSLSFSDKIDVSELSVDFQSAAADVAGTVTNHSGYLLLAADATVTASALCGRCDSYFTYRHTFKIESGVSQDAVGEDVEDEYLIAEDGTLDLDEAIRCFVSLELPTRFLCKESCKGLCPVCGHDLNEGDCGCDRRESDPRWDALKGFFDEK